MPRFVDIFDKSLKRIVDPTSEPVTVAEAKLHCAVPAAMTDFDNQFSEWITAARETLEDDIERALMPQTWELAMERFPSPTPYYSGNLSPMQYNVRAIELLRPPVTSISSLTYYDQTATQISLTAGTDYLVNYAGEPCLITPPTSNLLSGSQLSLIAWPPVLPRVRCVVVTFVAGYADAAHVPARAKQAIKLLVGHWWRNREAAGEKPNKDHDRAYGALVESLRWRD